MSESAESVAVALTSSRNITVEITNQTLRFCLVNPKLYLESGQVYSPPQPTVRPQRTELCNFTKLSGQATGTVGVMTYDLFKKGKGVTRKVAIMFSVPHNYTLFKNWMAIGIYPTERECNEELYKEMYNDMQPHFIRCEATGSCLMFEGEKVDFLATMSPNGRAVMKVELWEKVFSQDFSDSPYE